MAWQQCWGPRSFLGHCAVSGSDLAQLIWLTLGFVILANSRPTEGALAALPAALLFLYQLVKNRRWKENGFWLKLVLPCLAVLALGVFLSGSYNRAITGSALKPPYILHEEQYQESPPFIFLPQRPQLTYSSIWLRYYYEFRELHAYDSQRIPKFWVVGGGPQDCNLVDLLLRHFAQCAAVFAGIAQEGPNTNISRYFPGRLLILPLISDYRITWRIVIDLLLPLGVGVLWYVFDDLWGRFAIATCSLLMFEMFFTKWFFPHYFAPAAPLVWYLQTEGLRKIWNWKTQPEPEAASNRAERRRITRKRKNKRVLNLRGFVYAFPVLCVHFFRTTNRRTTERMARRPPWPRSRNALAK